MTIEFWKIIFNFLVAVKWPLTIIIVFLITKRSFKKMKEETIKQSVNKIKYKDPQDEDTLRS
jgi:hypothetical protein